MIPLHRPVGGLGCPSWLLVALRHWLHYRPIDADSAAWWGEQVRQGVER